MKYLRIISLFLLSVLVSSAQQTLTGRTYASLPDKPTTATAAGWTNGANLDLLAYNPPSYYLNRANHTGTIPSSVISDFNSAVSAIVGTGSVVTSINSRSGAVTLTAADVGLPLANNTSDANKPISTAVATALAGKEPTLPSGTTGQYLRGDKTMQTLGRAVVGLNAVDNTSDIDKPISTATQAALDTKLTIGAQAISISGKEKVRQNTSVPSIQNMTDAIAQAQADTVAMSDLNTRSLLADFDVPAGFFGIRPNITDPQTKEFQAAADFAVDAHARVNVASGFYHIAGSIDFRYRGHWAFIGAGRGATKIIQDADNTPIFRVGVLTTSGSGPGQDDRTGVCADFKIEGFELSYQNVQPATNTAASCIQFTDASSTTYGPVFTGVIRDIRFTNYYLGITAGLNGGVYYDASGPWGMIYEEFDFGSGTGGAINMSGSTFSNPNNQYRHFTIDARNYTLPAIRFKGVNNVIENVEILSLGLGSTNTVPGIYITVGSSLVITGLKFEVAKRGNNSQYILIEGNSATTLTSVKFNGPVMIYGTTMEHTGTVDVIKVYTNAEDGLHDVSLDGFTITPNTGGTTGVVYLFNDVAKSRNVLRVNGFLSPFTSTFKLSKNTVNDAAKIIEVRDHSNAKRTANIGNASYSFYLGGPTRAVFSSPITTTQYVDLPGVGASNSGNDILNTSLVYRVTRLAGASGTSPVVVRGGSASATVASLDPGEFVEIGWDFQNGSASGWEIIGGGTLP